MTRDEWILEQTKELLRTSRLCVEMQEDRLRRATDCIERTRIAITSSLVSIRDADRALRVFHVALPRARFGVGGTVLNKLRLNREYVTRRPLRAPRTVPK
jgi:hypothetical protein